MVTDDDIYIVFEKVVRIDVDQKPALPLISSSNVLKSLDEGSSSLVKSKFPDTNFSVDDKLQILTNNELDYDFGIDEMSALYGSDYDEGIGTESPRSDYLSTKIDIPNPTPHIEKKAAKSHVIEKVSPNTIQKKRKSESSDFSRKVVKAVDRIEKIDSTTSKYLKDILDRSPASELKKLNFSNHIDLLMQVSFIAHDYEKTYRDAKTRAKAYKVIKYIKNCLRSYVDNGPSKSILNRLSVASSEDETCIPRRNYMSFEKWTNVDGDLFLEKVCDVGIGKVSNPLGCAYDSTIGFLFTGPSEIYSCSVEGVMPDVPMIGELNNPSAIVVIRPGELLGVLDRNGIYVYDLRSLIKYVVATGLNGMCRGLAVTEEGFLLTSGRVQGVSTLILYDPKEANHVAKSCPFPVIHGSYMGPNPCFISSRNGSAYITDLGQNCIVCVNSKSLEVLFVQDLRKSNTNSVKFNFVSGIVMDSRNNLLVADAQNRSLYYLDGLCRKGGLVKVSKGYFPYSASFDVSPCGSLLACCRKTNSMALFKITGVDKNSVENVVSDLFDLN
ncbi:unnamed protein product [Auanema sp. JU1783]|nr:unnamed protein product [Auanema sp. JU1783]